MSRTPVIPLLLFAALFAGARPSEADLPGYDDAYYARKALEVIRTGDWLGLPFNGSPTFDNPPLGIWAGSLSFLLFGASPVTARLPSVVYGVLTVIVTFCWIRKRTQTAEIAFLGAALFLCNPLYLKYLRRGMLDMGFLFWCVLALWAVEWKPLSRLGQGISGVSFGLAFLTKSALALCVPAGLALGWFLEGREGRRRLFRSVLPGVAGFSLVVVPWLVAMHLSFGASFFRGHFGWLLWGEGIAGISDTGRAGSLAGAGVALLPLSLLFLLGAPGEVRRSPAPVALALVPLGLVTLVGARKLWYFLPALPGMAAAAGAAVGRWTENRPALRMGLIRGTLAVWLVAAAVMVALPVPLHRDRTADVRAVAAEVRARVDSHTPVWLFFPGESCRWDLRNAFLWNADRRVAGCEGEEASYGGAAPGGWVLTTEAGVEALSRAGRPSLLWFERGDLKLLTLEQG